MATSKHLIIASLPDDPYYQKNLSHIEDFLHQMAEKTSGLDDFLVIYPHSLDKKYKKHSKSPGLPFGDKCLRLAVDETLDLWMRDFGLVTPKRQIKFTYRPKYLKSKDAKYIDGSFTNFLSKLGISTKKSDIVLDGGNVVDNNNSKVIISERILAENKGKSKATLKHELENLLESNVAFIPDIVDDTTGHSDGMVSFIEDNVLLIADYHDSGYYNSVETVIKSEFPDVTTVRLPFGSPDDGSSDRLWKGFTSAVGCHVNTLVTNNALYVPQFGNHVYDSQALDIIKAHTSKTIVPIDTSRLSHMGGSVRCMTWQVESTHSIAQLLYKHSKLVH